MSQTVNTPDFAYPAKVQTNAAARYEAAMKAHDWQKALRALIDKSLASTVVNPDSLQKSIAEVEHFASTVNDAPASSLASLLAARMYYDAYNSQRYVYDRRTLPLSPIPSDISAWSGEQFRSRINSLCDSALADAAALKAVPLSGWNLIISVNASSKQYFPTLYDFVAASTIDLRQEITDWSQRLPLSALCPVKELAMTAATLKTTKPQAAAILSTYASLLDFHKADAAPYIYNDIRRIVFTQSRLYASANEKTESRALELYRNLRSKFADSPYSCAPLLKLAEMAEPFTPEYTRCYAELNAAIAKFPAYPAIACLKNKAREMALKSVELSNNFLIAPRGELKVNVTSHNSNGVTLKVYRLPDNPFDLDNYARIPVNAKAVYQKNIAFAGRVPFKKDTTVAIPFDRPGSYIIAPAISGVTQRNQSYPVVRVSALCMGEVSFGKQTILVVDPVTGAPVDKADIMQLSSRRNAKSQRKLGTTDSSGFLTVNDNVDGNLRPVKGNDRFAWGLYTYRPDKQDNTFASINLYSDLAIYHPGDSVQWACIAYRTDGTDKKPIASQRLRIIFRDTNYTPVDTSYTSTDAHGRATGSFTIPEGLLTGNFTIQATTESNDNLKAAGSIRIMVSDYKLPTYYTQITSVAQQTPSAGCVTIKGKAVTYTGIPLAGINVDMTLASLPFWWWRNAGGDKFWSATSVTDESGAFEFVITPQDFALAPDAEGAFSAAVTTTSATGENAVASRTFTIGDAYRIEATIPSDINAAHQFKPSVTVIDNDSKAVDESISLDILKDSAVIARSIFKPGETVSLDNVESGIYTFRLTLPGKKVQNVVCDNIAVFRPTDKTPPRKSPVWVPVNSIYAGDTILYGTTATKAYVLYTAWTEGKLFERKWIETAPGIHSVVPQLPDGVEKMTVSFMSVNGYETSTSYVAVKRRTALSGIKIIAETWRNKVIPQSLEELRLKVIAPDSTGVAASVILDMYNAALDNLSQYSLNLFTHNGYTPSLNLRAPLAHRDVYTDVSSTISYLKCVNPESPVINTYGRSFAGHSMRMYKAAMFGARSATTDLAGVKEHADLVVVNEAKAAAPESVEEEAADEAAPAAGADSGADTKADDFTYRPSEIPLAFFAPMLNTDAQGNLTYSFRVPNANATWAFKALAYTDRMDVANFSATTIASKPVMVTPNLPRFVRTGDTIDILAQVFNNADSAANITTVTEIFAPATGRIIKSDTQALQIAPNSSQTVRIALEAPLDAPFVGYRIKSSTTGYADGEQSLIPVLPSSAPVYESTAFYVPADSKDFSVKIPATGKYSRTTLTYCDNPLWYVVAALPGLRSSQSESAIDAAGVIYSVAVARGLLKKYPAIADAIRYWNTSDKSDSTLVSMLSRNDDMKMMLLQATPWMLDAQSDTERMQRLSLLFDSKECNKAMAAALTKIEKLQSESGGIAWLSFNNEPSLWATAKVLSVIGNLNTFGFMPDDTKLKSICGKALDYLQQEYGAIYATHPDSGFGEFAYVCSLWSDFTPSTIGKSLISREIQRTVGNWKKMDVEAKAQAALMLKRFGHDAVARAIIASLTEYAVSSPEKGMWWPSLADRSASLSTLAATASALEAYALITPGAQEVERIRQWLILQKETSNWGASANASAIVTAILASSDTWIEPASATTFYFNGKKLDTAQTLYTGEIKLPLKPSEKESTLSLKRTGATPAWGAVTSVDIRPMAEVTANSCAALSINKRILVADGTAWKDATHLKVGDRVKIQLTIVSQQIIDYLAIADERSACLEPVEQLPTPIWQDDICFYRENRDNVTDIFVSRLPKGTFVLEYEMWVNNSGAFSSGIATAQSQYAPAVTAHSAGRRINVDTAE
ncbi:MAG: hypothetical protein K2I18_00475 [Paramuribaculum sp.]|nr:hypothetical protein [Paramuribaculum sp.]